MYNTKEIQELKTTKLKQHQEAHNSLLLEICAALHNNVNFHEMTRFSFYLETPKRFSVKRKIMDIAHKHGYHAGEVVSGKYQNCIKIFTKEF